MNVSRMCPEGLQRPQGNEKGQPHNRLTSYFLVAPTGFEPATSALRGRSKRKALHNTSERFR